MTNEQTMELHQEVPYDGLTVHFLPNEKGNPPGKLADVELHFCDGPLAGLKLVGFVIWERRAPGLNVTFPARTYSINGERRSFALLRSCIDTNGSTDRLREFILGEWAIYIQTTAKKLGDVLIDAMKGSS